MDDRYVLAMIDLVCWDFGDTLVDETFMRLPPEGIPEWSQVYAECFSADPSYADRLDLGQTTLHELIGPIANKLNLPRHQVARHLRANWERITWFPEPRRWVEAFDGAVLQAVVTVNPTEFSGIAVACDLDPLVDVIVTSADVGSLSKPVMAERARMLLGLAPGLESSLLIDNKAHNTEAFVAEGGHAVLFDPAIHAQDSNGEFAAHLEAFGLSR